MEGQMINITRFCIDDGPGIRTTVFLKGCPLRCIWCHNPESQNLKTEIYDNGEIVGQKITAQQVLEEVKRDKVFYESSGGGVTVSGGEPLFQPEFTAEVLRLCKKEDIHTAIETSGFAAEGIFRKVLQYCDLVMFDLKETNLDNHLKYTGVTQEKILHNLGVLNQTGIPFILRLPIIPGLNDRREHFFKVKEMAREMRACKGVEIMPYHTLGEYKYQRFGRQYMCSNISEPSGQQVESWKQLLEYNERLFW